MKILIASSATLARRAWLLSALGYAALALVADAAGAEVTEASGDDIANAVAVDGSGNVVVAGSSYNGTDSDFYTAKYAGVDGALVWEQRDNGLGDTDDAANALALDRSGNVVVTGYAVNALGVSPSWLFRDYYTAKYASADGSLIWEQAYDGVGAWDEAVAVVVDATNDVVLTGHSPAASGTSWDYYTAKYSAASGTVLWEQRYNGPGGNTDFAKAVAVDSNGNVVVAGRVTGSGGYFNINRYYIPYYDLYTAKYAAGTGALLWKHHYHGPVTLSDETVAVAVDNNGNVVVTGTLVDGFATLPYGGTGKYLYTAKYAAADGTLVWEQIHHGDVSDYDVVRGLALDASGNVIISGSVGYPNALKSLDLYTAKYAAADGALLWENHYNNN